MNSVKSLRATRTYSIIITAFFAALTAVCSQIAFSFGPVPINLALFAVFTSAGLLGMRRAVISQVVYVLLGAVGVPVFAGFKGGVAALAGPTGGYIIGYIVAAFGVSMIIHFFDKSTVCFGAAVRIAIAVLAMVVGLALCYAFGTAWFIISTGTALDKAMALCVVPFLPGDTLKIAAATAITLRLKGRVFN